HRYYESSLEPWYPD
nr:Chain B, MIMOTOPE OF THE NICOTINIC ACETYLCHOLINE RECEPTOR [synthetic construct]1JBD_B Chain B, MIMOTOPE OF THE NICOTINIC ACETYLCHOLINE RECEPTOR [synthetic construct]